MTAQPEHSWRKILSDARRLPKTSWNGLKWFFMGGLTRLLLGAVLLSAILLAYRLPADFIDQSWQHFDVPRRLLLWFLRGTAVRSILSLLSLLVGYSVIYWWRHIRNRQFIVVSGFRIWGDLTKQFDKEGMVARLRDELMRLGAEMRASKSGQPPETASAIASPSTQWVSDAKPILWEAKPILWEGGGLLLPGTYITLQYEGISLEAIHTFIRRFSGREAVITGDLLTVPSGLLLVARTDADGPWEVLIKDSDSLELGLQQLALRIFTTFAQKFLKDVDTFVFLQRKAADLGEHKLLLRLAELEVETAVSDEEKKLARKNLAKAHNIAAAILSRENPDKALQELDTAIELDPELQEAIDNRELVREALNSQSPEENNQGSERTRKRTYRSRG